MSKVASKKCLIVDDEMVRDEDDRENFLARINLPEEKALFARSYEEAIAVLNDYGASIAICLLDCIIPKNNEEFVNRKNFVDVESEWGLKLIPFLKSSDILIYSAHISIDAIAKKYKNYNNIIDCAEKSFLKKDYQLLQKLFEEKLALTSVNLQQVTKKANGFEYDSLKEDIAKFVKYRAEKINNLSRRIAKDSIDIGKYLNEVKEKLEYGDFLKWIQLEFPWGKSNAYMFMGIARRFPNFGSLDINLSTSVLYELSKKEVPQEAVDEVFERAKEEKIIQRVAVEIIEKYSESDKNEENAVFIEKEETYNVSSKVSPEFKNNEEIKLNDKLNSVVPKLPELVEQEEKKEATDVRNNTTTEVLKQSQPLQIVKVQHNLVKDSYWQIGDRHRLFCGSPENSLFIQQLPPLISLVANYSHNRSGLLENLVEAETRYCFQTTLDRISLQSLQNSLEQIIFEAVAPEDVVIFAYLFDPSLFNLAIDMECVCYAAEPNLDLCEQLLDIWRDKGEIVKRLG